MSAASTRARWISRALLALRLGIALLALLALRRELADVDGASLRHDLGAYAWPSLALALACTAASFLLLGLLERLALRDAARLPEWRAARAVPTGVALVTGFVANAISQSIGFALLTGATLRARAYSRHGLGTAGAARVGAFATLAATLGLLAVGAVALAWPGAALHVARRAVPVRAAGVVFALPVLAYLAWPLLGRREAIGRGRWRLHRPTLVLAAAPLALAAADWLLTGTVLFALLPAALPIAWFAFLRAFVVAQVLAMASHVPGGVGVFEAALVLALAAAPGARAPAFAASLVMYRLVYYVLPLLVAMVVAGVAELRAERHPPPLPVALALEGGPGAR